MEPGREEGLDQGMVAGERWRPVDGGDKELLDRAAHDTVDEQACSGGERCGVGAGVDTFGGEGQDGTASTFQVAGELSLDEGDSEPRLAVDQAVLR